MPRTKLDKLVRARMRETGETFQTARNAVLAVDSDYVNGYARQGVAWRGDTDEFPDPALDLTWIVRPERSDDARKEINDRLMAANPALGRNPVFVALGRETEPAMFINGLSAKVDQDDGEPGSVGYTTVQDAHHVIDLLGDIGTRTPYVFGMVAFAERRTWHGRGAGTLAVAASVGADAPTLLWANRHGPSRVREVGMYEVEDHFGCLASAMHQWLNDDGLAPVPEIMEFLNGLLDDDTMMMLTRMGAAAGLEGQAAIARTLYIETLAKCTLDASHLGVAVDVVDHVAHEIAHGDWADPDAAAEHLIEIAGGRLSDTWLIQALEILTRLVWGQPAAQLLDMVEEVDATV